MGILRALEVIWVPDETIEPPGPKMVVCIHPENGWFYRINTRNHWRPAVALQRDPHHAFLKYDSFLQCGDPLELDDYIIEESLRAAGVIGKIYPALCLDIMAAIDAAIYLKEADKAAIRAVLNGCLGA